MTAQIQIGFFHLNLWPGPYPWFNYIAAACSSSIIRFLRLLVPNFLVFYTSGIYTHKRTSIYQPSYSVFNSFTGNHLNQLRVPESIIIHNQRWILTTHTLSGTIPKRYSGAVGILPIHLDDRLVPWAVTTRTVLSFRIRYLITLYHSTLLPASFYLSSSSLATGE